MDRLSNGRLAYIFLIDFADEGSKDFCASVLSVAKQGRPDPVYAAFTGFTLAWTPGTNGPISVEPVWAPIHSKASFAKYHGKLQGKALLMFAPAPLTLTTRADAQPSPNG